MAEALNGGLISRLRAVWRREVLLHGTAGGLAFIRWSVPLFLTAILLDWTLDLPAAGRLPLLAGLLTISCVKAWRGGWRNLRPFHLAHVALRLEEHLGGQQSLLVSAVQLSAATQTTDTSSSLIDVTCRRAEEAAAGVRPAQAVRMQALQRPAVLVLLCVLMVSAVAGLHSDLLHAGLLRFFQPWKETVYPTRTQIVKMSESLVVQEGHPVRIVARIGGVIPETARIALRTGTSEPREREIPVDGNICEYAIGTAFRSFDYRILAGDARSEWHAVTVVGAPTVSHARVRLDYPDYTQRASEEVQALTLTVPETTRVTWTLALDRPVREATLRLSGMDPQPLPLSADGRTVTFERIASESRAYGFGWVDRAHGFAYTSPNQYLQVAPDRPPRVELVSPERNMLATLGRKLDLAFRSRDDHGISESVICYRVDKTAEERVPFRTDTPAEGAAQPIDWDYRTVLPDLKEGQSVTFAIEVADSYPGDAGPHRVRSEARRIRFVTPEEYRAQIERQKKRLLSRLRSLYREEREVHETILRLDPTNAAFVQTCQLEAVRQDLMRERVKQLVERMQELTDDLEANGMSEDPLRTSLLTVRTELLEIADAELTQAAEALRALAGEANRETDDGARQAHAADAVNRAARELGLRVLELGFADAADVMAREMHAAAETQAALRLNTILSAGDAEDLAQRQTHLSQWLARLFAASPKQKESTVEEALVEFTLTRLVKQLVNGGLDSRMQGAAAHIRQGEGETAAMLQSEVIAALLKAEFRLRVGAEREALMKALVLLQTTQEEVSALRATLGALEADAFEARRTELAETQNALHKRLQLLLMPAIPAPPTRLFALTFPSPPPVNTLLAGADVAMTDALSEIRTGNRETARISQQRAEAAFEALSEIIRKRIAQLTQAVRMGRLAYGTAETIGRLDQLIERQLSLLEKAEDADADETDARFIADQEDALAEALGELLRDVEDRSRNSASPTENSTAFRVRLQEGLDSMREAIPLLKANTPGGAIDHQLTAENAMRDAQKILAEHTRNLSAYAAILALTRTAIGPSQYVSEIEQEQRDMHAATKATAEDNLPSLAIPQKNLVHAVNAILTALDPMAHLVQSGTVMLFAKEDMGAAGIALEEKDPVEAEDAQLFVIETLEELRNKIDAVVPAYLYLRELTQALHESAPEAIRLREAQRILLEKARAGEAPAALAKAQDELKSRTEEYGSLLNRITGMGLMRSSLEPMAEAHSLLTQGDVAAAAAPMEQARSALDADVTRLLDAMERVAAVLNAPPPDVPVPEGLSLLLDALPAVASQVHLLRQTHSATADRWAKTQEDLQALAETLTPLIERATQLELPADPDAPEDVAPAPAHLERALATARDDLLAAAGAKGREVAAAKQLSAADSLRHFVVEFAVLFYMAPGGGGDDAPAPTTDFTEAEDMMQLFMPGAVTGTRPPDGRVEWEVLGRRDRAALNENFARELPLEYRAILKDYYERLTQ